MAATKVTVTLDDATLSNLEQAASRLSVSKSEVVRQAINTLHDRRERLSESERLQKLKVLERMALLPPSRPQAEADAEIEEIRRARRGCLNG